MDVSSKPQFAQIEAVGSWTWVFVSVWRKCVTKQMPRSNLQVSQVCCGQAKSTESGSWWQWRASNSMLPHSRHWQQLFFIKDRIACCRGRRNCASHVSLHYSFGLVGVWWSVFFFSLLPVSWYHGISLSNLGTTSFAFEQVINGRMG